MASQGKIQEGQIWAGEKPLILASRSEARRALLSAFGILAELMPADLDERAIEAQELSRGAAACALARRLAAAKACAVSAQARGRFVLGGDQILTFNDRPLAKSADLAAAAERLRLLAGQTHLLVSACAVARDGTILFEAVETAELTMRTLTDAEIKTYLDAAGEEVLASVGAYRIESIGRLLFERVEGDHATILGLPLTGLLRYLRSAGLMQL
jgi:septum formation protein